MGLREGGLDRVNEEWDVIYVRTKVPSVQAAGYDWVERGERNGKQAKCQAIDDLI